MLLGRPLVNNDKWRDSSPCNRLLKCQEASWHPRLMIDPHGREGWWREGTEGEEITSCNSVFFSPWVKRKKRKKKKKDRLIFWPLETRKWFFGPFLPSTSPCFRFLASGILFSFLFSFFLFVGVWMTGSSTGKIFFHFYSKLWLTLIGKPGTLFFFSKRVHIF